MIARCFLPWLCMALAFDLVSSESNSIYGAVNQSVTFNISTSAPLQEILWTKDKDKVVEWDLGSQPHEFSPFEGRINLEIKSGTLTIFNLSSSDEGIYEFDNTKQKFSLSVFEPLPSPELNFTKVNDSMTVRCWIPKSYKNHLESVVFSWRCSEPKCANTSTREILFEKTEKHPQEIFCIVSNLFFQANSSISLTEASSASNSRNRLCSLILLIPVLIATTIIILGYVIYRCQKRKVDRSSGNEDEASESLQEKSVSNKTEENGQELKLLRGQKSAGDMTEG